MTNLEYLNEEFKYLNMDSNKKEYLKECYKDIISTFKIETSDNINVAYRLGVVFNCITEARDDNDFNNLIMRSSEKVGDYITDDVDEEKRNENKIIIEILSLIYKITTEDEFKKFRPLTSLEGKEGEWIPDDPENPSYYMNKRYNSVVADDNKGTNPKNIYTKLYTRDNGNSWYSDSNEKPIKFPYEVPTTVEKVYLENYVKDIYGPSIIINSLFAKDKKKGTPKYVEYCLGFLPSTSEGQYNNNDFRAKYSLLIRSYDPLQDKFVSYDIASINDITTREDAMKTYNEFKSKLLEDNIEITDDVDLKELF